MCKYNLSNTGNAWISCFVVSTSIMGGNGVYYAIVDGHTSVETALMTKGQSVALGERVFQIGTR